MDIPKIADYFLWQENEKFYFLPAGIKHPNNLWLYNTNTAK